MDSGPILAKFGKKWKDTSSLSSCASIGKVLFIPILDDAHWILYVVIHYIGHGISTLKGREGILYMDPLNGKPNNNIECYVRSVIEIIYGPRDRAKNVLLPPITTLMIPHQPNGTDCGFYIMHAIKQFIEDVLQGLKTHCLVSYTTP